MGVELQFNSVIGSAAAVVKALKSDRVDKALAPQIQNIEATVLGLLKSSHMTAGMVQFVIAVLNITDRQMKPEILRHLNITRNQTVTAVNSFQTCSDKLTTETDDQLKKLGNLPARLKKLEDCIYNQLTVAQLADGNSNIKNVNWNIVETTIAFGEVDATEISEFVTGNWTGNITTSSGACKKAGISELVTTETCKTMENRCKDFVDANGIPQIDLCDSALPKSTSVDVSTCGSSSSPCCKNPFAGECGKHEPVYTDKGAYYEALANYWGSMVRLWDESQADCVYWCKQCRANSTACPVVGLSTQCPVPIDPVFTTTTTTRGDFNFSSNCATLQDEMDAEACQGTKGLIESCNNYTNCYKFANTSLNFSYTCGPNGDLEILKNQYYAVLRIECLVYALNTTNGSAYMAAQIETCRLKTIADYDLSMFRIPECDLGHPLYMAGYNPSCLAVSNVSNFENCSGTAAYAQKYYSSIHYHKPCTQECCRQLPASFVPR